MKAEIEVLSMRPQYFCDIVDNGIEEARKMEFLCEQGHKATHSKTYRTFFRTFSSKIEV